MRDVELAFARRTPKPTAQGDGILLGEGAAHGRRGAWVLAQGHHLAAQRRVPDLITPGRRLPDGSGITAIAERLPGLPERRQPGLLDELEEAAGRGIFCRSRGIEIGFNLGGGEQVFKARAGRLGCLANGAGNSRGRRARAGSVW